MSIIRVRFAPSPTGFMHLGNVRAALLNFLFARQKEGTFILRIEDTDQQRLIDPEGLQIMNDLAWLHIEYDEGPRKGGKDAPYYQSERSAIYTHYLEICKEKNQVYRCFCTAEELERKRQRQLALKQPPRYDRACLALSATEIAERLAEHVPFIWRFKLNYDESVTFYDLAHKMMHFDLKHFSDAPLTRQDGSFTFMFANFVDDMVMKITHVFRGEDHLTNTAVQVAMYHAFNVEIPVFWHLPIIGNAEGKKLSKRDFGFSLTDLRNGGFLPEALVNYLAIIGHSVTEEIMDMNKLIHLFNFEHLSSTGQIRYDLEKLRWVNHQWIMHYDTAELAQLVRPFLLEEDPAFESISDAELIRVLRAVQPELITLKDAGKRLQFILRQPEIDPGLLAQYKVDHYRSFFKSALKSLPTDPHEAASRIQSLCKEQGIPLKDSFSLLRIALTGIPQGPSMKDLLGMLPADEVQKRLAVLS